MPRRLKRIRYTCKCGFTFKTKKALPVCRSCGRVISNA